MALILKTGVIGWMKILELRDFRLDEFHYIRSPLWVFGWVGAYAFFVYKLGPALMKDRSPFVLKEIMMAYNLMQILLNCLLLWFGTGDCLRMNFFCAPIDKALTPENLFMIRLFYCYHITKVIDLLDTIFFVLRKKESQITFLHLYHHMGMVVISWVAIIWFPGGQSVYLGIINCIVHVVMYFYYFLTAWDSKYKNILWLKKFITQMQLAQHTIVFFLYLFPMLDPDCTFPKVASFFVVPQAMMMILLFSDFYIKAYVRKPKKTIKNQ